jgi:magnesium chelatase subunit D
MSAACATPIGLLEVTMRRTRSSTCPSAPPKTASSARSTSRRPSSRVRNTSNPGVLASANRGVLYVDEVNLLDDHVVDLLLDSAAMGVNVVEREGISFTHPAKFILVGTMNPEEGDLRPQLLDRFAFSVHISGLSNPPAGLHHGAPPQL